MKRKIGWEKWQDPFNFDYELDNEDDDDEDETSYEKMEKDKYDPTRKIKGRVRQMPIMPTKNGPMPMSEYTKPGYLYNFWVGHTNFELTYKDVEMLDKILGIETLDIFTPLRFRIAVGKMFDFVEVRSRIHNMLIGDLSYESFMGQTNDSNQEDISSRIIKLNKYYSDIEKIRKDKHNPFWAVYILPNGKAEILQSEELSKDFVDRLSTIEATKSVVGGILVTYMDEEPNGELNK